MRRIAALLCFFASLSGVYIGCLTTSLAAPDARRTMAREIVAVTNSREDFERVVAQLWQPMLARIREPEKAAALRETLSQTSEKIRAEMVDELANLMAEKFSEPELIKIRDFTLSDVGRKMRQFLSPASPEMMAIQKNHMGKLMALIAMAGSAPSPAK